MSMYDCPRRGDSLSSPVKFLYRPLDAKELMQTGVGERVQAALQRRAGEAKAWYLHIDLDVGGPEQSPGGLTRPLLPTGHHPSIY